MKLPDEGKLASIDTKEPKTIRDAYQNCLLEVEMLDGTIGIYDGDNGMDLSTTWRPKDLYKGSVDQHLTALLQKNFSGIKSVKIHNL